MKHVFWVDKNRNNLQSKDIDDAYLLNIVSYIAKGRGYLSFLTENRIHDIYDECLIRNLKPPYRRSELLNSYRSREDEYSDLLSQSILEEMHRNHEL